MSTSGNGTGDFAEAMRAALAAKEDAEGELAEAVAASAMSPSGADETLEKARDTHAQASSRVATLIEEASLYAARSKTLTDVVERQKAELEAEKAARKKAEAALVPSREAAEQAKAEAAKARLSEAKSAEETNAANEEERAARQAEIEAVRRARDAEETTEASNAACQAMSALMEIMQQRCDKESQAARHTVSKAHEMIAEARRATDLEVGEARRDTEVHRQRRAAARTELLSVAKALEAARGEARTSEQAARDQLVPRLENHCVVLGKLVERAVALGGSFGLRGDALLSTSGGQPAPQKMLFPVKYLGELADEIQRVDTGLDLLSQTFDVLEDAANQRANKSCLASLCFQVKRPNIKPPSVSVPVPGRARNNRKGYHRVQSNGADDEDDDDTVL